MKKSDNVDNHIVLERKDSIPRIVYYVGIIALLAIILPYTIYRNTFNGGISGISSEWSNFGGYYGGIVGPLLNFISVILIIITIILQNESIKQQEKDTKSSIDTINKNNVFLQQQVSNISLQRFESNFNYNLNQRFLIFNTFKTGNKDGSQIFRDDIDQIISNNYHTNFGDKRNIVKGTGVLKYIGLFNYIIIIANSIKSNLLSEEEQRKYFDILRYSLTESELILLIIAKSKKELSHNYVDTIMNILGEYNDITLNELSNAREHSLYLVALENGIIKIET